MNHPLKINGWNLKITQLKMKIIFQTSILGSMLILQGVYDLQVFFNPSSN